MSFNSAKTKMSISKSRMKTLSVPEGQPKYRSQTSPNPLFSERRKFFIARAYKNLYLKKKSPSQGQLTCGEVEYLIEKYEPENLFFGLSYMIDPSRKLKEFIKSRLAIVPNTTIFNRLYKKRVLYRKHNDLLVLRW